MKKIILPIFLISFVLISTFVYSVPVGTIKGTINVKAGSSEVSVVVGDQPEVDVTVCGDGTCSANEFQSGANPCVQDCGLDCDNNGVKESWSCVKTTSGLSGGTGGGGGGGGGGYTPPAGKQYTLDFAEEKEDLAVKENDKINFELNGQQSITVSNLYSLNKENFVELSFDGLKITIQSGKSSQIDIDSDGIKDLTIIFNNATDSTANLSFIRLTETFAEEGKTEIGNETVIETQQPSGISGLFTALTGIASEYAEVIVLLIILGAGLLLVKKKIIV